MQNYYLYNNQLVDRLWASQHLQNVICSVDAQVVTKTNCNQKNKGVYITSVPNHRFSHITWTAASHKPREEWSIRLLSYA
jgi:hypothetical protein